MITSRRLERLWFEVMLSVDFFNGLRRTRKKYPEKTVIQHIEIVVEGMRQAKVAALLQKTFNDANRKT